MKLEPLQKFKHHHYLRHNTNREKIGATINIHLANKELHLDTSTVITFI